MKQTFVLILISLLLVLFQTAFFPVIFGAGTNPNLVLAFIFSLVYLGRQHEGMLLAIVGGLLLDLLGFTVIGLSSILFLLSLYLAVFITKYVFRSWIFHMVALIFCSIVYSVAQNLGDIFISKEMIIGSLFNVLFMLIFFIINKQLLGRVLGGVAYLEVRRL